VQTEVSTAWPPPVKSNTAFICLSFGNTALARLNCKGEFVLKEGFLIIFASFDNT
jgi:hypothetical protein